MLSREFDWNIAKSLRDQTSFYFSLHILPSITADAVDLARERGIEREKTESKTETENCSRNINIKRATNETDKNIFALNNYIFSLVPLKMPFFVLFIFFFCCCRCWSMFWHFVYFTQILCTQLFSLSCRCLHAKAGHQFFLCIENRKMHRNEYRMFERVCVHTFFFLYKITTERIYRYSLFANGNDKHIVGKKISAFFTHNSTTQNK